MSYHSGTLGSDSSTTSFPDVIINTIEGTAQNKIASFAAIVFNPRSLKTTVESLAANKIPDSFPDAVMLLREEEKGLSELWDYPLACSCPVTTPLPWTTIEATVNSKPDTLSWEFNIMRTLNFIGRNVIRIDLPMINCSDIMDEAVRSGQVAIGARPEHTYLGAYYRDIIPRIIKTVSFYPRSSSHDTFVYTGYDLFMYNLVFGNERKEMNDLLAGEDRFELCYDPFRVDGSAMGIASYKGIDAYSLYADTVTLGPDSDVYTNEAGQIRVFSQLGATNFGSDSLVDYFQLDDTMDLAEFADAYRKNVWYEAPIAQNYWARHSIHSRRMCHYPKSIHVPLDILPFSYSLSSALPVGAISGECGFIKVELYEDWLDRAFYLTKVSDIPPLHPIPQHVHYQTGDTYLGENAQTVTVVDNSPLNGWVNERSLGRFGDSEFIRNGAPDAVVDSVDNVVRDATGNFDNSRAYAAVGSVVGGARSRQENLLPTRIAPGPAGLDGTVGATVVGASRQNLTYAVVDGTTPTVSTPGQGYSNVSYRSKFNRDTSFINKRDISTTVHQSGASLLSGLSQIENIPMVYPMSLIDKNTYIQLKNEIKVHLFQIGFQSMRCIVEWLTKMPNLFVCTEWNDMTVELSSAQATRFEINNSLYQTANFFMVLPTDPNGIESMRYYPCHAINHEMPIINKMKINTSLNQAVCTYDWSMLNLVNAAFMGFKHPLLENIGVLSFSPEIRPNSYPYAFYDPNICGKLYVELLPGEDASIGTNQYAVNVRSGKLKVITTGVNALVLANMTIYRMVF